MVTRPTLAFAALLACVSCQSGVANTDPTAIGDTSDTGVTSHDAEIRQTNAGLVRGHVEGDSLAFLGIPYAEPPVGELRWRKPIPSAPWDGILEANAFGERCTQAARDDDDVDGFEGDEDCLYLNVWTPNETPEQALPVLVYIHGGGNIYGSSHDPISAVVHANEGAEDLPLYGGARLAAEGGIVVVTFNYRLAALGYLSHAFLDADSEDGTSGNYGLYDAIAALQWVQDNIAAFGGDPDRVLLAGQSGGGRDTNALLTCNSPEGLFAGVAIHSAPLGLDRLDELRDRGQALVEEMGCDGHADGELACMREVPAELLVTAVASTPLGLASGAFIPTVDGTLCEHQPIDSLVGGHAHGVPMLMGTTDNEYSHRWPGLPDANYDALVRSAVGDDFADDVLVQYPLDRFGSATVAFSEMMSDRNVTCPNRRYARTASATNTVHHYRFRAVLPEDVRHGYGAYHTSDIVYLFQHMDGTAFEATEADRHTQAAMRRYWSRFAATGDPGGGDDPTWPAYDVTNERTLILQAEPSVETDVKKDDCDFWESLIGG